MAQSIVTSSPTSIKIQSTPEVVLLAATLGSVLSITHPVKNPDESSDETLQLSLSTINTSHIKRRADTRIKNCNSSLYSMLGKKTAKNAEKINECRVKYVARLSKKDRNCSTK